MNYILNNFVHLNLQMFADAGTLANATGNYVNANTGATTAFSGSNTMSPTMKTYYDTELLENARNEHYFTQFGKKQPLPRGRGKIIEWRKWNTLPNAKMLTEGVIPTGEKFGQTYMTSGISQYGMFVTITDQLELHALDDVILGATEELGASAGETQDTVVRNVLVQGTNVLYADTLDSSGNFESTPTGRWGMTAGNNRLTPDMVAKAATSLKKSKAPTIDGKYVAVIHPSIAYDLRSSEGWIEAHKYAKPDEIFNGEIGELHNVRFIESTTAPVFSGTALNGNTARYLPATATYVTNDSGSTATHGTASAYKLTITETPTADLVGRFCHVYDDSASAYTSTVKIVGVDTTNKYLWLDVGLGITPASGDKLYPGEGAGEGSSDTSGSAVYGCIFFGKDAYGLIDPDGAGMEMITHSKGEVGGPLDQFSTVGYKFSGGTKILYEDRMLRVECCSAYSKVDEAN